MKKLLLIALLIVGCEDKYKRSTPSYKQSNPYKTKSSNSVSNFKILDCRGKWESGRFRVIGEVKNIGNIASGVQIEAIARDSNGKLIGSEKFWPNSTNNLSAGSSTGIGFTITKDPSAKTMECRIVSQNIW